MTQCPSHHTCTTIQDDCDDDEGLDSSYSFREEGRGIRESYTYDERDLDPESWKQSELGPEYKSGSEPISEPFLKPVSVSKRNSSETFLKPVSVSKRNSKIFVKPVQEPKKIILLDSGSKPDNNYLFESVSELDIELPLQSGLEPNSEVSQTSVSEPNNKPFHEPGLEPAKGLLFEPVSEPDIGHLFESGSEYDSDSESEYTDLGLHMTDFDMPPTDSMKRELSSFEMLVTVENERKRQAKMAEQARMVEFALPTADSIKASRKYLVPPDLPYATDALLIAVPSH